MQILFALLLAMGITVLLVPPLIRAAAPLGLVDPPNPRKVHTRPIPRVGGIAMTVGLVAALLIWRPLDGLLEAYFAAVLVLLIFGVLDDRLVLAPAWKLAGQMTAALIVMHFGDVHIASVATRESAYALSGWVSAPLTLGFLIGITNAINLADGLDGLAGGITLLCLSALVLLGLTDGNTFVALGASTGAGAVLGFLRYNTHPARIFMGDAGSQLLGFTAAILSVAVTQAEVAPFSTALPLLLLGVPIIDTLTVMIERMLAGKSPFKADRNHVHHRLLALGFSHEEAVIVLCGGQALLLVLSWQLRYSSDALIVLVFAGTALSIVTALRIARLRSWRWREAGTAKPSWVERQLRWLHADARLSRWSGHAVALAIVSYAAFIVANDVPAPTDVRILAMGAAAVLVGLLLSKPGRKASALAQAALYVSALVAVFLDRRGSLADPLRMNFEYVIFVLLAAAIVVKLCFSVDRRFRITPVDVLLLVIAIALPNLPAQVLNSDAIAWTVVKTLLLFYGIEVVSIAAGVERKLVMWSSFMFLVAVALGAAI